MTSEQFDKIILNRLDSTKGLLTIKAKEYVRNNNPLHNFEVGSDISKDHTTKVLDGMLLKHYISYRDMLSDVHFRKPISLDYIKEKFGDILVYFIIQEIMFIEYSNENS